MHQLRWHLWNLPQLISLKEITSKAFFRSGAVMMPSLSLSMMPKASLNSWICFWENREKMFEPDFFAFFDPLLGWKGGDYQYDDKRRLSRSWKGETIRMMKRWTTFRWDSGSMRNTLILWDSPVSFLLRVDFLTNSIWARLLNISLSKSLIIRTNSWMSKKIICLPKFGLGEIQTMNKNGARPGGAGSEFFPGKVWEKINRGRPPGLASQMPRPSNVTSQNSPILTSLGINPWSKPKFLEY